MAKPRKKTVQEWASEGIDPEVIPPNAVTVKRDANYLRSIAVRMRAAVVELTLADVLDDLERAAQGGQMAAIIDVPDRMRALDKLSTAEAIAEALMSQGIAARPVKVETGYGSSSLKIEASWRDVRV